MLKLFTNGGAPDQTSDLGLHYLPITFLRVSRLQWVKTLLMDMYKISKQDEGYLSVFLSNYLDGIDGTLLAFLEEIPLVGHKIFSKQQPSSKNLLKYKISVNNNSCY